MSEHTEKFGFASETCFERELENFNRIITLINDDSLPVEKVLSSVVKLLPGICHKPELISAALRYHDQTFRSDDFRESSQSLSLVLWVSEKTVGAIEIHPAYLPEEFSGSDTPKLTLEILSGNKFFVSIKNLLQLFLRNDENKHKIISSENRYQNIIEAINEVIYDVDIQGNILYASRSVKQVLGFEANEVIGKNIFSFIYPEDIPKVVKTLQSLGLRDLDYLEYRYLNRNGDIRWVHSSTAPRYDKEGVIIGGSGVLSDITEKKHAEEAIRKSEEKFRNLVESINDVIFDVSLDGTIHYVSPSVKRMLGYETHELNGKNFFEYMYPEDIHSLKKAMKDLGKKDYSFLEYRYFRKDKSICWVRSSTKPIYDNGILTGGSGVLIDITEKKKFELQLLDQQKLHLQSQELGKFGYWKFNLKNNELYWSDETFRIFELDKYQFKPSYDAFLNIIHPLDRENVNKAYQDSLDSKNSYDIVHRLLMNDGRVKYVNEKCHTSFDSNGTPLLSLGTIQDITHQYELERQIHEKEERLRQIAEQSQTVIWEVNSEGLYTYVSPVAEKVWGYRPDEIIGKLHYFDMHPNRGKEKFIKETRKLFDQKQEFSEFQNPIITKDGKIITVSTNGIPILDGNGILVGYRGADNDITEKLKVELEIKEQNDKLFAVIQTISDLIFIVDKNGCFLEFYANDKSELILKPELIIGSNIRDTFPKKESEMHLSHFKECFNTKKTISYEYSFELNNKTFFYESRITPIDEVRLLVLGRNITEKKKTEKEIHELNINLEQKVELRTKELNSMNERLFREIAQNNILQNKITDQHARLNQLIKGSRIGTWEWDLKTDILSFSSQSLAIFGYTEKEMSGMTMEKMYNFIHVDDHALMRIIQSQLKSGERSYAEMDIRQIHKDDGYVWLSERAHVESYDEKGKPRLIFGTLIMIHEQKKLQLFEKEISEISPILTGLTSENTDKAILTALERMGRFLEGDRSYIFEFSPDLKYMSTSYEWSDDGIPKIRDFSQNLELQNFSGWMQEMKTNQAVIMSSKEDVPKEWKHENEMINKMSIKSLIFIPIRDENIIGFLGIEYIHSEKKFDELEIKLLKFFADIFANIITSKRKDNLLRKTQLNYEAFYNSIDDYLFIVDMEGKIITCNNMVIDKLGFSLEELTGKSLYEIRDRKRVAETKMSFMKMITGESASCTVPLETKNGILIPVESNMKKGFWNEQEVYFSLSKDLTELKRTEQKFSSAFQSNSAMMSIVAIQKNKFLDVNDAFLDTLGYTREEVMGKSSQEVGLFLYPQQALKFQEIFRENKCVRKFEFEFRTKEGEIRSGLMSADIIFLGDEICSLSVVIDITERNLMELELSRAISEAEKANSAKSEFLSRMSHELRTPLNSILGFAQLLEMGSLNTGQQKGVNHIIRSGKHLLDLINEVLEISRIEAGRISIVPESVSVNSIVYEMLDLIKPLAHSLQINVILDIPKEYGLFIWSDQKRTRQILLNLLNNAIKYNKTGGSVTLKVEKACLNQSPEKCVRFSVIDTGYGISEEDQEKIFVPFERIGAETSAIEGTGLGLAVVKKLIDALEGRVGVKSELGSGSTFWFELPMAAQDENQNELLEYAVPDKIITPGKGILLYIEDNLSNVELVEQILVNQRENVNLITTVYGSEALKMALVYKPDLILLDLNLPDMHGHRVLEELKMNQETRDIPVVIISADAMPHQLDRMMEAGALDYLTKPIHVVSFLKTLDKYMTFPTH